MASCRSPVLLAMFLGCGVCATVRGSPEVLALHTRHQIRADDARYVQVSGLLVRELARQALLVAARDELGLITRDASLREIAARQPRTELRRLGESVTSLPPRPAADDRTIDLLLTVDPEMDGKCTLRVFSGGDAGPVEIWSHSVEFKPNSRKTYPTLAPQFEALARDGFVELLQAQGAVAPEKQATDRAEVARDESAELSEIDALLERVDLTSQFVAVRRLHALNQELGDSPERLGRLVNGYAHLGLLTECYWGATSRVFKARSMIYAERLLAKYEDYRLAKHHWNYAQAIAGIHLWALQSEQSIAERTDGDGESGTELPAWSNLTLPYCQYDVEKLTEIARSSSPVAAWAHYLRYWVYFNSGEKRLLSTTARETVAACPEAFNVFALMAYEGQLGVMHQAGQWSIYAMARHCAQTIAECSELPEEIRTLAAAEPSRKAPLKAWGEVSQTLHEDQGGGEFAWSLLGNLMEETAVMVGALTLRVARGGSQEHTLEPYVGVMLPAIKNHPDAAFFHAAVYSSRGQADKLRQACLKFRFVDPNLWQRRNLYYLWQVTNEHKEPIGFNADKAASRDFTASSLVLSLNWSRANTDFREMLIRELGKVSPASPVALAHQIEERVGDASDVTTEEFEGWKKSAAASPAAWVNIGKVYVKQQEYDNAYECFERSFELSPTEYTAREWAWAYERAGELDKVVPTFEKYLDEDDLGLGHSNTHYEIARYYLRHDKPSEAKPHALTAAESWSGRGLGIAARVFERLDEKDEADRWYRELSRAYPSTSGITWYLWRRRSGNDDIAAARKLAERQLGVQDLQDCRADSWWPLTYYAMESDRESLAKFVYSHASKKASLYNYSQWLVVALDVADASHQQHAFRALVSLAEKESSDGDAWPGKYVQAIQDILDAGSPTDMSTDELDALVSADDAALSRCDVAYFFAEVLEVRGYSDLASRYRDWAVSLHDHGRVTWHMAAFDAFQAKKDATPAK